jgi:hypothetical protein
LKVRSVTSQASLRGLRLNQEMMLPGLIEMGERKIKRTQKYTRKKKLSLCLII